MSLSVLSLGPTGEYILYDGKQKKAILMGSQNEMFDWKDKMESEEQHRDNRAYMDKLREDRMALLVAAGHSQQSAEIFLKKQMPYLFETA